MNGICQLCNEEKELIGRSHIFPNFLYNGMQDERNRLQVLSTNTPEQRKYAQSGAYNQYILCQNCDNIIISRLERYANNNLFNLNYLTSSEMFVHNNLFNEYTIIECTNIDYTQFKLFLETLLWRVSISSHAMFNNFSLSCEENERLRQSILNGIPLSPTEYPCIIYTSRSEDLDHNFVVIDPNKNGVISFYINKFIFNFYHGVKSEEAETLLLSLKEDNTMPILLLDEQNWKAIRQSIILAAVKIAQRKN